MRWWKCGLLGGVVLSLATLAKAVAAAAAGRLNGVPVADAAGFAAALFGIGFVCGVAAWGGRGLSRRFGVVGDAAVGLLVMVVFFLCCMLLVDPGMLGGRFRHSGLPMLGLAAVLGPFAGVLIGRDFQRQPGPWPRSAADGGVAGAMSRTSTEAAEPGAPDTDRGIGLDGAESPGGPCR